MSIDSDIATALAGVSGGGAWPFGMVPEKAPYPLCEYRRLTSNPINTLSGYSGTSLYEYVFECWGAETASESAKALALAMRDEVAAAIEGAAGIVSKWRIAVSGEDYDQSTLDVMEPVGFGFSHE